MLRCIHSIELLFNVWKAALSRLLTYTICRASNNYHFLIVIGFLVAIFNSIYFSYETIWLQISVMNKQGMH